MRCQVCRCELAMLARGDARFCSGRCRVAAHRRLPPQELRGRDRWVRFEADKRPIMTSGRWASSTNADTWTSFEHASSRDRHGVGVGFVLNGDGIVCVDLDHCLVRNRLTPWAAELLEDCPATFIERSVSGAGLHVWGWGDVDAGRRFEVGDGGVEVYGTSRYIAVTGRRWSTSPAGLADLSGWLPGLVAVAR